jgi:sensor histidine kinase regulating citrate/malate metabolism
MTSHLEDALKETLRDLDDLSPSKISNLVQESLKTFQAINEGVSSQDSKERQAARHQANSLKKLLSSELEALQEAAGGAPIESQDLQDLDERVWGEVIAVEKDLRQFQNTLDNNKVKFKRKANKSNWMVG